VTFPSKIYAEQNLRYFIPKRFKVGKLFYLFKARKHNRGTVLRSCIFYSVANKCYHDLVICIICVSMTQLPNSAFIHCQRIFPSRTQKPYKRTKLNCVQLLDRGCFMLLSIVQSNLYLGEQLSFQ
jgi:hypothetical protein